ncbi:hypothetical protein Zmor_020342 [Zophobas morio]|uniref:Uncharacterized protein n=1 Tax=Zophobas morio TaxID=2755281 RepID=A0AA38MA76_9CUCU|nr:hypothetical protein Zmor_020342 [Zophobas morio]
MYKIIPAQLHWVFSTLVGLDLLTEFSSRCLDYTNFSKVSVTASRLILEHPSRHPLPGSSPAAVTDNELSWPYILEPISVVPGGVWVYFVTI